MLQIKATRRARLANAAPGIERRMCATGEALRQTRQGGLTAAGGVMGGAPCRLTMQVPQPVAERAHHEHQKSNSHHPQHRQQRLDGRCGRVGQHQRPRVGNLHGCATQVRPRVAHTDPTGGRAGGTAAAAVPESADWLTDGCGTMPLALHSSQTQFSYGFWIRWNLITLDEPQDTHFILRPLRYGLRSWYTLLALGLSQFWPYFLPVVWAKVTAGYNTIGCLFNCVTAPNWDNPHTRRPLPHKLSLCANFNCKFGFLAMLVEVVSKVHAHSISVSLKQKQAYRSFLFISASLLIQQ